MEYVSSNIVEPEAERRWSEAGRPPVPSFGIAGAVLPLLHVSQLAAALGLPAPAGGQADALAWDLAGLVDAWAEHLQAVPWELAVAPTPSRGRSLRNLTVNAFHPIELLPVACEEGRFPWDPDGDRGRELLLRSAPELRAYAERIAAGWSSFLLDRPEGLPADRRVRSPRGEVSLEELLVSQRWHAAYHYRQLVSFLDSRGAAPADALQVGSLEGIALPSDVF